jgi:hypothetical protein
MKKPATGPSDGIKANLISGGIFDISLDNFKEKQRWKCPYDVGAEGGTRLFLNSQAVGFSDDPRIIIIIIDLVIVH